MNAHDLMAQYLRPYQRSWLLDPSPKKICLKSRQIGMSEAICLEALVEALASARNIYLVSTNFSNAKDLLKRIKRWVSEVLPLFDIQIPLHQESSVTLTLFNGSVIQALPCKPESVRGKTGSIYLDEAAHYADDMALWEAIAPVVSSNPNLKIRILSTPWGASGLFYDLWSGAEGWSRHEISIYDAVEQGYQVDIEEIKKDYTSDQWEQEFCCSFSAGSGSYHPKDLLLASSFREEALGTYGKTLGTILAVDPASVQDRASLTLLMIREKGTVIEHIACYQGLTYPALEGKIKEHHGLLHPTITAIDQTGPGLGLTQTLQRDLPNVIGVNITQNLKEHQCPSLKRALEQGEVKIAYEGSLLADFASVREVKTANNKRTYITPRSKKGHGDTYWASLVGWSLRERVEEMQRPVLTADYYHGGGYAQSFDYLDHM